MPRRTKTRNHRVIWKTPRRNPSRQRITTPRSSHWLPWDAPHLGLPSKLLLPFDHLHPIQYTHPSTDPTRHSKRQPDPISRFATIHPPDRQTDWQTGRSTDGLGDRSVPTLYWLHSDAANNMNNSVVNSVVQRTMRAALGPNTIDTKNNTNWTKYVSSKYCCIVVHARLGLLEFYLLKSHRCV